MAIFLFVLEQNAVALARLGQGAVLPPMVEWASPGGFVFELEWDGDAERRLHYREAMHMAFQMGLWARTANVIAFRFAVMYHHNVQIGHGDVSWRG